MTGLRMTLGCIMQSTSTQYPSRPREGMAGPVRTPFRADVHAGTSRSVSGPRILGQLYLCTEGCIAQKLCRRAVIPLARLCRSGVFQVSSLHRQGRQSARCVGRSVLKSRDTRGPQLCTTEDTRRPMIFSSLPASCSPRAGLGRLPTGGSFC